MKIRYLIEEDCGHLCCNSHQIIDTEEKDILGHNRIMCETSDKALAERICNALNFMENYY